MSEGGFWFWLKGLDPRKKRARFDARQKHAAALTKIIRQMPGAEIPGLLAVYCSGVSIDQSAAALWEGEESGNLMQEAIARNKPSVLKWAAELCGQ